VIVLENPVADAGPDQTLEYQFDANLNANEPGPGETGSWSVFSGSGTFNNSADAVTSVNGLAMGRNVILWTLTNGVCPPSADSVIITVRDLIIPTLITPNNDGRNDYFIVSGIDSQGIAELIIFDRRGARIYRNENYDNTWDGIDDKGNPIPDDTYFYVINFRNGRSRTGFIVVRH
jgi:trimeric autotransporter adhesin